MPLRNILQVPPGGWRLSQTLPDGTVKSWHSMNEAWTLAGVIADFRKGNGLPRATQREALDDIDEATCARLHDDPAHCVQKKTSRARAAISRLSKSARAAATGGRTVVEWLGTGAKAVDIPIAQSRANVCLECDRNKDGHSWLKLTANLVRAIAEHMNAKEQLKLRVAGEEKLHTCSVCDCVIPLKIWLRREILAERTSSEVLHDLPEWCWLKKELHENHPTDTRHVSTR